MKRAVVLAIFAAGAPNLAHGERSLVATTLRAVLWVVFCVLAAELAGYLLHSLLHSEKLPWLSRSHMEHHLEHYGPRRPMRPSATYIDATAERWSIGNVGMEWIVPSIVVLGSFFGIFSVIRLPWSYRVSFMAIALAWSAFMFNYLHDRMHVLGFWMEKNRVFRRWFVAARRLHDIHHLGVNNHGKMDSNFGIGFSFFDHVFGTFRGRLESLNEVGISVAQRRYAIHLRRPAHVSTRSSSHETGPIEDTCPQT